MKIEIVYKALKTTEIEVDDSYKAMLNDDEAWDELIGSLSEIVLKEVQKIENNYYFDEDDILGVSDVETDETIYEN